MLMVAMLVELRAYNRIALRRHLMAAQWNFPAIWVWWSLLGLFCRA